MALRSKHNEGQRAAKVELESRGFGVAFDGDQARPFDAAASQHALGADVVSAPDLRKPASPSKKGQTQRSFLDKRMEIFFLASYSRTPMARPLSGVGPSRCVRKERRRRAPPTSVQGMMTLYAGSVPGSVLKPVGIVWLRFCRSGGGQPLRTLCLVVRELLDNVVRASTRTRPAAAPRFPSDAPG